MPSRVLAGSVGFRSGKRNARRAGKPATGLGAAAFTCSPACCVSPSWPCSRARHGQPHRRCSAHLPRGRILAPSRAAPRPHPFKSKCATRRRPPASRRQRCWASGSHRATSGQTRRAGSVLRYSHTPTRRRGASCQKAGAAPTMASPTTNGATARWPDCARRHRPRTRAAGLAGARDARATERCVGHRGRRRPQPGGLCPGRRRRLLSLSLRSPVPPRLLVVAGPQP